MEERVLFFIIDIRIVMQSPTYIHNQLISSGTPLDDAIQVGIDRVNENNERMNAILMECMFNLGQQFHALTDHKEALRRENILLTHQITELKMVQKEAWNGVLENAKDKLYEIASHITSLVQKLKFRQGQYAEIKENSRGFVDNNFQRTTGALLALTRNIPFIEDWLKVVEQCNVDEVMAFSLTSQKKPLEQQSVAASSSSGSVISTEPARGLEIYKNRLHALKEEIAPFESENTFLKTTIQEMIHQHDEAVRCFRQYVSLILSYPPLECENRFDENYSSEFRPSNLAEQLRGDNFVKIEKLQKGPFLDHIYELTNLGYDDECGKIKFDFASTMTHVNPLIDDKDKLVDSPLKNRIANNDKLFNAIIEKMKFFINDFKALQRVFKGTTYEWGIKHYAEEAKASGMARSAEFLASSANTLLGGLEGDSIALDAFIPRVESWYNMAHIRKSPNASDRFISAFKATEKQDFSIASFVINDQVAACKDILEFGSILRDKISKQITAIVSMREQDTARNDRAARYRSSRFLSRATEMRKVVISINEMLEREIMGVTNGDVINNAHSS